MAKLKTSGIKLGMKLTHVELAVTGRVTGIYITSGGDEVRIRYSHGGEMKDLWFPISELSIQATTAASAKKAQAKSAAKPKATTRRRGTNGTNTPKGVGMSTTTNN